MMKKAVHGLVTGRVQLVGYRQTCRQVARSLSLVGWVRNLADGRVEFFAQGEPAAIDRFLSWAWTGPGGAVVTGLESDVVPTDATLTDFLIQPSEMKNR